MINYLVESFDRAGRFVLMVLVVDSKELDRKYFDVKMSTISRNYYYLVFLRFGFIFFISIVNHN